ncbi:MAG: CBS domain-containing protein [Desulfobacterales bacterium]
MKIKALMIPDPIVITEKASIAEAIEIMKINSIRHLPVVSEKGYALKGFVTMADLRLGLIPAMVSDISLSDVMIKKPIVVDPDDDIEMAAQLIYKHKIGGMPVVKKNKLVGIITESDILRAFINMMGILSASSRIDVEVGEDPDAFNKALQIIQQCHADIINIGMAAQKSAKRVYYFRLASCNTQIIKETLEKNGFKVVDIMG